MKTYLLDVGGVIGERLRAAGFEGILGVMRLDEGDVTEEDKQRVGKLAARVEVELGLVERAVAILFPGGDMNHRAGADEIGDLVTLFTEAGLVGGQAAKPEATEPAPPPFPQWVCPRGELGECGFIAAGVGLQCREGAACSRYLHPGDKGHAEVEGYYKVVAPEVIGLPRKSTKGEG